MLSVSADLLEPGIPSPAARAPPARAAAPAPAPAARPRHAARPACAPQGCRPSLRLRCQRAASAASSSSRASSPRSSNWRRAARSARAAGRCSMAAFRVMRLSPVAAIVGHRVSSQRFSRKPGSAVPFRDTACRSHLRHAVSDPPYGRFLAPGSSDFAAEPCAGTTVQCSLAEARARRLRGHHPRPGDKTCSTPAPAPPAPSIAFKSRYDNFIGGKFVPPVKGQYFDVITPITGKPFTQAARSGAEDIELALDAAHAAADSWGRTPAAERANVLLKIADRLEAEPRTAGLRRDRWTTASRSARRSTPTSRWPSTTSATSPAACARRKAA